MTMLFLLLATQPQLIVVKISEQRLYYFEGDSLIKTMLVSTAKKGYFTPKGRFRIVAKFPVVISRRRNNAKLIFWLGFTPNGYYGIHALPNREYEKKLGRPNSTGCIRLAQKDAEWLFKRAEVGSLIIIE